SYNSLKKIVHQEKPVIIHFHNTFPLISPLAYSAATEFRIPVIQTLHNYRLLCANALLFRNGNVCEDCISRKIPFPGLFHACYRNNHLASSVTVLMQTAHKLVGTWDHKVDRFIALSEFSKRIFIKGGLPDNKIAVKPNFLPQDPGNINKKNESGYGLYIGRLSEEKGVVSLIETLQKMSPFPFYFVGDGPLAGKMQRLLSSGRNHKIKMLGKQSRKDVYSILLNASFLVFPSICYENFPMVIVEAFAHGVPVIVSDIGAAGEIVKDGYSGLHFRNGNPDDLATKLDQLIHNPRMMKDFGNNARREYLEKYSEDINYGTLMSIYNSILQ
ncbi:MAG TPA: glycosyltransferase family 4 protein, partial [Ruminiclostridium sp.]|nr:glycosyltransferase family 4 protein [Ruminiclostridium sp.]